MAITLDGTTGISSVDGSSSSPSVRGSDSNSGIVYAADNVKISTGGTERLEVTTTGATITGNTSTTGAFVSTQTGGATLSDNLSLADNKKIKCGGSDDLSIFHDGSTNIIESASGKTLNFRVSTTPYLQISGSNGFVYTKTQRPWSDDTYDFGSSGNRWDDIYATNGTIQTSDKNQKNTINTSDLGLSFVNKLKPVSYKFNGKTRTHYGLIAQDIETTLSDISKSTTNFAGFIKTNLPDELYTDRDTIPEGKKEGDVKIPAYTSYGLRYNEFISPLIKAVQELSAEVETLKTKVAALEAA